MAAVAALVIIAGCGGDYTDDDFTLSATAVSPTEVDVQWPLRSDTGSYILSATGGGAWTFSSNQWHARLTGFVPGTRYCFYMIATYASGSTAVRRSNDVCVVTPAS